MSVSRKQIKAQRRHRREQAQQTAVVVEHKGRRRLYTLLAIAAAALFLLISFFAFLAFRETGNAANADPSRRPPDTTSRPFADQGHLHIQAVDSPHAAYNSTPPTSGPHMPSLAPAGWHDEAVPDEFVVHNLEDGYMAINYRPDLSAAEKAKLRALVEQLTAEGRRVLAVPYEGLRTKLALTAWTRLDELDTINEQRIRGFGDAYAYQGADYHNTR